MPHVRVTVSRYFLVFLLCVSAVWPASRRERYVLVLSDPPLAADVSAAKGQKIAAAQRSLSDTLSEKKIQVTSSNQLLANVIFVEGDAIRMEDLKQLPGVARAERLLPLKLHLSQAIELMNVPRAWGAVNGEQNAGAGVKIGILDSGIDHTH